MESNASPEQSKGSDEISLKDAILKVRTLWRFLLSKWLNISIAGIIGAVIGLSYSSYEKSTYKAQVSFALEDEKSQGGLSGALGLASQFGIDLGGGGGGAFSGDNLIELMKSRSMIEKALLTPVVINNEKITLAEQYIRFNKLREKWNSDPDLRNIKYQPGADRASFSLKQDSILGLFYDDIIKKNLGVDKPDKKLSIIRVAVNSGNELFSKNFAEVLVNQVSLFYIQTKTKKSNQNVNILQHQTDSVRRELNQAINGVASSIDATPNANPGKLLLRTPSQHRQVDVQADQAILTELVKNLEVAKVTLRKETPLIQIIDMPILPLEKEHLGKIKGIVLGGVICMALCLIWVTLNFIYIKIVTSES